MPARVATTSPNIPPVRMSLLMQALTDKMLRVGEEATRQAIRTPNMLPC